MEADLSEHFGRFGEFLAGLIGLFLLLLIIPDTRRLLRRALSSLAAFAVRSHRALETRSGFYRRWSDAFHILFRERRDLLLIVLALTAFDYLTTWHSNFILGAYDLYPDFQYDTFGQLRSLAFSASTALGLLRILGYALFCWIAFRVAAGDSYKEAARFRPFRRVAGLFLCITGCEAFAGAVTPIVFVYGKSIIGDISSLAAIGGGLIYGGLFCLLGARLFNTRLNGRISLETITAISGYLLLTHLLQWGFFITDLPAPSRMPWLNTLNDHMSNFTLTVLWNVILVGFAIALAAPKRAPSDYGQSHHAADAV